MDSRPQVLIVEDFEDLRKLVAVYLHGRGYQVLQAANGKAAIQTATSGNLSLILLDIRLPDMNGVDVIRELRKMAQTKHVPIIGWSAEPGLNPQREMLRHAGISDYIQKPTSLKDLDAAIERFLPKSKQQH
jgi:DNA-binding response OmpR family regulator